MAEDTIQAVQQALGLPQTDSKTRNHILYSGEGFTDVGLSGLKWYVPVRYEMAPTIEDLLAEPWLTWRLSA